MTPLNLFIAALTTWRLTALLVFEDGPFDLGVRLRFAAGIRYDEFSQPVTRTFAGKMLLCHRCTSVWVGLVLAAALALNPLTVWLMSPFALSAAAIAFEALIRRLEVT